MYNVRMIAIDMDGTLLDGEKDISRGSLSILNKLNKQGIKIVLATGRVHRSALLYGKLFDFKPSIVATNGSYVTNDNDDTVYEKAIDKDAFIRAVEVLEESKANFHFYDSESFYFLKGKTSAFKYSRKPKGMKEDINIFEYNTYDDIKELANERSFYKILVSDDDNDILNKSYEEFRKIKDLAISSSWKNNLELVSVGVDKMSSLKILLSGYGMSSDDLMAIGDNNNDISMIRGSKVGVAMKNATDELKRDAMFITENTNFEDGVFKFLREYFKEV